MKVIIHLGQIIAGVGAAVMTIRGEHFAAIVICLLVICSALFEIANAIKAAKGES
jgi:hypothetical protein